LLEFSVVLIRQSVVVADDEFVKFPSVDSPARLVVVVVVVVVVVDAVVVVEVVRSQSSWRSLRNF
jgi:uncharacterized protein (DUF983 family)